ncbi:AzlC family ABC transporter permease [Pannonibacter tanglangensis]|uniref:Branched-chain amino acid ABC transporter permease n=1 Tax=Pannonibacter tanglangensis TaxID=2750084 RepID=A0ABW9ZPK1_9HYPH|nr:AzlC family ABC transporter permease [Pannonibacter sp. XCT-34]NBN64904.1 branched-chain amino acid ABC transporter permease [Pannonibacter sp. XCT-34]
MRTTFQTVRVPNLFRPLTRRDLSDVGLVGVAAAIVGLSFGAIATGGGFPVWVPVVMSLVVFAGASQFAAIGVILAGGSPFAAVLAGLILNARHLPFGFSVAGHLRGGLLERLVGAHVLTDESLAFALKDSDPDRSRALYWACALTLFLSWNAGTAVGAVMGETLGDAASLGLDAAFPAVLLALVLPALKDPRTRRAAGIGAAAGLALTPYLPAGVPVLVSLVGLVALLGRRQTQTQTKTKTKTLAPTTNQPPEQAE